MVILAWQLTMFALSLVMSFTLVGWQQEPSGPARALRRRPRLRPPPRQNPRRPAKRWVPLFDGHDLTAGTRSCKSTARIRDSDHVITVEDGSIHLYKDAREGSNVVMGYIGSRRGTGTIVFRSGTDGGPKVPAAD